MAVVEIPNRVPESVPVAVRLYETLRLHLPAARHRCDIATRIPAGSDVSAVLATLGLAREEVDLVLIDGEAPRSERQALRGGERIAVFATIERLDPASFEDGPARAALLSAVNPAPPRSTAA